MLDMGFIHSLRKIAKHIPVETSDTSVLGHHAEGLIEELAATYLRDPVKVQVAPPGQAGRKDRAGRALSSPHGDKAKLLGGSYLRKHPIRVNRRWSLAAPSMALKSL